MTMQMMDFGAAGGVPTPILRAPPFPGSVNTVVSRLLDGAEACITLDADARRYMNVLRDARVGGTFWGARPQLDGRRIIARPTNSFQADQMLAKAEREGLQEALVFWLPPFLAAWGRKRAFANLIVSGVCDPWHLFEKSECLWLDTSDENFLLARVANVRVLPFNENGEESFDDAEEAVEDLLVNAVRSVGYFDPFSGSGTDFFATVALLEFWRNLIDSNREIAAAAGFAHWKKEAVEPLLWGGADPVHFISGKSVELHDIPEGRSLAIWKSRVPPKFLDATERQGLPMHEVEDGFIRSAGLGADCVPPLSIVVDKVGVHFDPSGPSELENLLQHGEFSPTILERAERLRRLIIETGVSKYGVGGGVLDRPGGDRRHILVTGQVEDDRSVLSGGGDVAGNLDLLRRARAQEPNAYIIYKPHPDVEAGHRKGHVPQEQALAFANSIVRDAPISSLLEMVDAVHVLTSLAGFEALIRSKQVITHGVPFYAGWGLTTDLGVVPVRRTARRDVIEMVAAVLLLYPRYLDPVTALPCPPEVLVKRLVAGIRKENWAIVSLRRLQGSARQKLSKMGITI